jgi:NAD(P)-dependent dehydrogenase (short-subunit alcohol dehydrogenase family)
MTEAGRASEGDPAEQQRGGSGGTPSKSRLTGAVVFLSGANRGLGRVLAEQLLDADVAKLYAAARRLDSLDEVVALDPGRVTPVGLDTTAHDAVDAAAELAADTTLLINNAGVAAFAPGLTAPPDDVAREMATNFGGTYAMVRAFAPVIEGNGGGAIVNVLSMAGLAAIPPLAGYSASKAAAHSMTQAVRAELRPRGIIVHGVYPAGIGTEMLAHESIPHSSPEEVAAGILAGVEQGDEDIFPCALSSAEAAVWWADPKGLERQHTGH